MADFPYFLKVEMNNTTIKCVKTDGTFYYCIRHLEKAFPGCIKTDEIKEVKHVTYINDMGIQTFYYMITINKLYSMLPLKEWTALFYKSVLVYLKEKN